MLKGVPLATERMLQIDNDVLRGASAVTVASAFEAGHPGMREEETMAVLLDLARNGAGTDRDAERGRGQGDDFGQRRRWLQWLQRPAAAGCNCFRAGGCSRRTALVFAGHFIQ